MKTMQAVTTDGESVRRMTTNNKQNNMEGKNDMKTRLTQKQFKMLRQVKRDRLAFARREGTFTKNQLYGLYVDEGLSTREIARVFACHPATVKYYLWKWRVPRRSEGYPMGIDE